MWRDNLQRSIRQVPRNIAWPASTSQSDPTRSLWHKLCSRLGQPVATQNVTAAEIHWPQGHSSHDGLLMSSGIYTKSTKSKKTCLPKRPEMDKPSLVNVCVKRCYKWIVTHSILCHEADIITKPDLFNSMQRRWSRRTPFSVALIDVDYIFN